MKAMLVRLWNHDQPGSGSGELVFKKPAVDIVASGDEDDEHESDLPNPSMKPPPPVRPMRNGHQFFLQFGRKEHGYNSKEALETWKSFSSAQGTYWHTRAKNYNAGIVESADDLEDFQGAKLAAHALT